MKAHPAIKVLLLAGELRAAAVLEDELQSLGYEVVNTSSGDEMIAIASAREADLVLIDTDCDHGAPGRDVTEHLHRFGNVPVIVLAANKAENLTSDVATNGELVSRLRRPFGREQLHAAIRNALANRYGTKSGVVQATPQNGDPQQKPWRNRGQPIDPAWLDETRSKLRGIAARLMRKEEADRQQVARDLHDNLGQQTALMGWRLAELSKRSESLPDDVGEDLFLLQKDLDRLAAGLRGISHRLYPGVLAYLGLPTALDEMAARYREAGGEVTFIPPRCSNEIPLEIATALYRIAQHALENARQHASGYPVLVTLSLSAEWVELCVEDPGPGFDLDRTQQIGGLGLFTMRERAALVGGRLQIATGPGEGTTVKVRVPLQVTAE